MTIKGTVHEVSATQQVTESLTKRDLIVEYIENPQYPEYLKFEAIQDRCSLLDSINAGDEVEVYFNLKGRKWTDKTGKTVYFNTLQLWKISQLSAADPTAFEVASNDSDFPMGDDDDQLPF